MQLSRRLLRSACVAHIGGWKGSRASLSVVIVMLVISSSCRRGEHDDELEPQEFPSPATPLLDEEVRGIVERAAESLDSSNLIVAVVDRIGNVLAVWRRDPLAAANDLDIAVSIARSAAFLSSSQGPLSSRTLEFISTFHFPATFDGLQPLPFPTLAPQRQTTGVRNTPQGPLWQIFTSNRGAPFAGPGLTVPPTEFQPGNEIPPARRIDGSAPGPGFGYLPGGIPLYKGGRVVGGVGCYGPDPNACEFAALEGAGAFGFPLSAVPPRGAIFLVGVLLPYVEQTGRPAGSLPGTFSDAEFLPLPPSSVPILAGSVDPEGNLIGPRADPSTSLSPDDERLSLEDVQTLVDQAIATANATRAAIRLPLGTTMKMVVAVTNRDGDILAIFRMPDAPIFSIDVAVTKARTVVYYSGPNLHPDDAIPGIPLGTAITTRTLGFLSQPFFPPNVSSVVPGPLYHVALENQDPNQYDRMGKAPPSPGRQSGLIFFPGSAPLYKGGQLVGGLGVSGDGVEQDDLVTAGAVRGFDPPLQMRADRYRFGGVRLPYFKFPQLQGR